MTDPDAPRRVRLPDVSLARLAGAGPRGGMGTDAGDAGDADAPVPLRARRQGTALVLLGERLDAPATDYLRQLVAAEAALREWDGRVLVIVGGAGEGMAPALAPLRLPFPVLSDPARTVAETAGVVPPAVLVCDQWGEIRASAAVTAKTTWLAPAELEQWMRFLAIQCAG